MPDSMARRPRLLNEAAAPEGVSRPPDAARDGPKPSVPNPRREGFRSGRARGLIGREAGRKVDRVLRVLAIDTALGACSACVAEAGTPAPLSRESIPMERGHAEALLPLIDRVVAGVEGGFESLERVAVTVGPGSYTGLRVGIAAARAIGLAAGVPVVGVGTLSALIAALAGGEARHLLAAAIDARHGHVYIQVMAPGGRIVVPPSHVTLREAVRVLGSGPVRLTGSAAQAVAAEALAQGLEAVVAGTPPAPDIALVARLAALADPAHALPKPLYLRGPDARPQDAARLPRQTAGGP